MKLDLLSIQGYKYPSPDSRDGLLIEMRGESGEVYHFGGTLEPGAKVEEMLAHVAGEIAATRKKRKRPAYKVASIMPGKIQPHLIGQPVRFG